MKTSWRIFVISSVFVPVFQLEDFQGGYHGNALQAASFRGREKVVQMLLDVIPKKGRTSNLPEAGTVSALSLIRRSVWNVFHLLLISSIFVIGRLLPMTFLRTS